MATIQHSPRGGFTSETSLAGQPPRTPPYTPHRHKNRGKRRLDRRSDSPASSIHPAETSSPAKKAAKRAAAAAAAAGDTFQVEELGEGDLGYTTDLDVDVVYPQELEEVETSDGDDELSSSSSEDEDEDEAAIARRLSRLRCGDENAEADFEKGRRLRRMSKRMGSRVFKRSHSETVKSEVEEVMDAEAMDDQDVAGSQRRLRRRVRGPKGAEEEVGFEDAVRSESEVGSVGVCGGRELLTPERDAQAEDKMDDSEEDTSSDDAMDVDGTR